jgi:hypothetical protein
MSLKFLIDSKFTSVKASDHLPRSFPPIFYFYVQPKRSFEIELRGQISNAWVELPVPRDIHHTYLGTAILLWTYNTRFDMIVGQVHDISPLPSARHAALMSRRRTHHDHF